MIINHEIQSKIRIFIAGLLQRLIMIINDEILSKKID